MKLDYLIKQMNTKKKFMDINKLALEDEHLYSYLTRAKLEYSNIKLLPLKSKD